MNKKKIGYNIVKIVIALAMIATILPSVFTRISNENRNNSVVVSLLYNDIRMKLSEADLDSELRKYKRAGVTTMTVQEEDLNALINSGTITCIKYNVLKHKYDDESEDMIKQIDGLKNINNDSYILVTKRDESKQFLSEWIPKKYTDDEYYVCETALGADMYVLYDGLAYPYQISVGYKESELAYIKSLGFEISLDTRINNYSNLDYLDEYDRLIKKYDVKFLAIRDNARHLKDETEAKANYMGISKLIQDNDLTLVLTEDWATQLGNEEPMGYDYIFKHNMNRVIRSYETFVVQPDPTEYMFRYQQCFNSTIDRSIRFINATQIVQATGTYLDHSKLTQKAIKEYVDKMKSLGFNTETYDFRYDYEVNRPRTSAAALVLIGLMLLTMVEWLMGRTFRPLTIIAAVCCVLGAAVTFFLPQSLLQYYPSLFAVVSPCFCLTAVFKFAEKTVNKLGKFPFFAGVMLLSLVLLVICGTMQGGLLSGIDYYVNYSIFHGTKATLYAPVVYSMVAYYMLFVKRFDVIKENVMKWLNVNIIEDVKRFMVSDIKVYWVLIAAAFFLVVRIYIRRSGNVNVISGLETFIRNSITEQFTARPRMKEFVAWPCLMLFAYYLKVRPIKLVSFAFGVGGSIVFASIINSFCHVFTHMSIIYSRVFIGAFLSIFTCIFAYILNIFAIRLVEWVIRMEKKIFSELKGKGIEIFGK